VEARTDASKGALIEEAAVDDVEAIACGLNGDDKGAQMRRWLRLSSQAGLGRAETEDGVLIRFRDEPVAERELRALVAVESDCCAWARWQVLRADGELVMRVSSTPTGAVALHAMFAVLGTG
jgi:hypothetical protein